MCSICFVNAWAAVQVSPQFARPSCSSIAVHFSVSVCVLIFIRQGMGGSAGKSSFCMDHLQLFRCAFRVYVCMCVCVILFNMICQRMGGSARWSSFCTAHLQLIRCAFRVYVCMCMCVYICAQFDSSTHGRQRRLVLILHGPPAAHLLCIPCVCVYVYV